jgi:outer membrane protein assembly factor BamD
MTRFALLVALAAATAACGSGVPADALAGTPAPQPVREGLAPPQLDSLFARAEGHFSRGKWSDAATEFERFLLEAPSGDSRLSQARFYVAESRLAQGEQLTAAREFRRISDETPNDPLAPEALLRIGDAYADLWRRPELDPSYGQTAIATYQELLNRYPGTGEAQRADARIRDLQNQFAYKQYRAALYYLRLKAYDSAILYLKDLVATYPQATVAPDALLDLVGAYRRLGYQEDVQETCVYLRRFHPGAEGLDAACPAAAAPAG